MKGRMAKPTKLVLAFRELTKQIVPLERKLRTNKIEKAKILSFWFIASVSFKFFNETIIGLAI
eukprot:gene4161-7471_t